MTILCRGYEVRRSITRLLSIFFLYFLLFLSAQVRDASSQNQKTFLWRVQSKTNIVYVLGSLHSMRKENYPLDRRIEDAFDKSDVLVVEANINDMSQIDMKKLMEKAFYQDDDTLQKHLSPETYELAKKEIGQLGLPSEIVQKQRPWFLATTLTALQLAKLGFDPTYGIDKHFLSKAQGRKKILELESIDYQMSLLSGSSDKDGELFLLYTLKDLNKLGQETDGLFKAWSSGDTEGVESIMKEIVKEDGRLSPIYEKLIYERNRKMASKIEDYLRTKETYLVIVGAGHLVGDRGVIEKMREKGYAVEQL